ncbi:MAG TPA: radical SAM protein [Pyrinomonadaceae bacterium]|jgi:pyruvate-formate lyase-activating enzyme
MKDNPRILFVSPHNQAGFDFYGYHTKRNSAIQLSQPRIMWPGLRFIKQNFPQIEILEFPTWEEYTQVLSRGWDIVGFSFFTDGTNEVLQMADYARKQGIKELWAGNYGAMNPLIRANFDEVFTGYSEIPIAEKLGVELGPLIHPPLIDGIGLKPLPNTMIRTSWLYTARGCPLKCTFCQTPSFAPNVVDTPLESIERVIRYYKEQEVQVVLIYDEIFGISRAHAQEVVSLLRKYEMPWGVMTRSDILGKNLDEWHDSGLIGVVIGIESMNPATLKEIKKKMTVETTIDMLERLHERNIIVTGTYIIGFEGDTVESVKRDFQELQKLKPDFMKIYIATPFPETPLWDDIQKYGIDTSDWSKFDGKHLVWNHPHLSREDGQMLLEYGYEMFNSEAHVFRFMGKLRQQLVKKKGPRDAHSFFLSSFHNLLRGRPQERNFFESAPPPQRVIQPAETAGLAIPPLVSIEPLQRAISK